MRPRYTGAMIVRGAMNGAGWGVGLARVAVLVAACALVIGCASTPDAGLPTVTAGSPAPFAPVRLQVHPLTHLDVDPDNVVRLICHVELKDRWGDTTKARGLLRIELYRPSGDVRPDLLTQELSWQLDLRDLELNASLFDPATRSYRLQLGGLPAWAEAMARRMATGTGDGAGRLLVRAVLETQGPDARPTVLRDELQIQG